MGRKRGISTHRKSSVRKSYRKPCNASISVVSSNDNVLNPVKNKVIMTTKRTPVSNEDVSGNHPHLVNNTNVFSEDSPCSRLTNSNHKGRCIMPLLDDANNKSIKVNDHKPVNIGGEVSDSTTSCGLPTRVSMLAILCPMSTRTTSHILIMRNQKILSKSAISF